MKQKGIISILLACVMICSLCACGNGGGKVYLNADTVRYHAEGMKEFGFNINMAATAQDVNVEFVECKGTNVSDLSVTLADDTPDSLKEYRHNNYYFKQLGVSCTAKEGSVEITHIVLKINGEETTLSFSTPVKHTVGEEATIKWVIPQDFPLMIPTSTMADTDYTFSYIAENDITLESFAFNDFVSFDNDAALTVNGEDQGKLAAALPLDIESGSEFSIRSKLNRTDSAVSQYSNIYCDFVLDYTVNADTKTQETLKNNFICQGVTTEEDAKAAIELLTANLTAS